METLVLRFLGFDLISGVLGNIKGNLESLGQMGQDSTNKITNAMSNAASATGRVALLSGIAFGVLAAAAYNAIKAAATYDQAVLRLYTHGSLAHDQLGAMNSGMLALSASTGVNATEMANAMYYITSAGLAAGNSAQGLLIMGSAAQTAAMTGADLVDTTRTLTYLLSSGIIPMRDVGKAAGLMNAAISQGVLTAEQMNTAYSTGLLPTAHNAGISFSDMAAGMDLLTRSGFSASTASTALRNELIRFQAGGPASEKALQSIGLSHAALATEMQKGDLIGALDLLHQHLSALSSNQQIDVIYKIFGGTRGTSAMLAMMRNLSQMPILINNINTGAGNFATMWQDYLNTAAGQTALFKTGIGDLRIAVGQALEPGFISLMKAVNPVLAAWTAWVVANPKLIAQIISVGMQITGAIAAVFGFTSVILRLALVLSSPVALAVAAVLFALYELATHWDQITQLFGGFVHGVISGVQSIASAFSMLVGGGAFDPFIQGIQGLMRALQALGGSIFGSVNVPMDGIVAIIENRVLPIFATFSTSVATYVINPLSGLVDIIRLYVVPVLGQLIGWFGQVVLGALPLAAWLGMNLPRAIGALINIVGSVVMALTPLISGFITVGRAITTVLLPALTFVVAVLGTALVAALQFLGDHFTVVQALVYTFIAAIVALRAIAIISWIQSVGGVLGLLSGALIGVIRMAGGLVDGVVALGTAMAGAVVPTEAEAFALNNAVPIIGTVVAVVGALALALMVLTGHQDTAAAAAKDHAAAIQGLGSNVETFNAVLHGSAPEIQGVQDKLNGLATVTESYNRLAAGGARAVVEGYRNVPTALKPVADSFANMDGAAKAVITDLVGHGQGDMLKFYDLWKKNNGDTALTLDQLGSHGDALWLGLAQGEKGFVQQSQLDATIIANQWHVTDQSMAESAVTSWQNILAVYKPGSAQAVAAIGMLSPAAQDVVRAVDLITKHSGLSVSALQSLGADGTIAPMKINLNGTIVTVHGTLAQVVDQVDAVIGKLGQVDSNDQHLVNVNGAWMGIVGAINKVPAAMQSTADAMLTQIQDVTVKAQYLQSIFDSLASSKSGLGYVAAAGYGSKGTLKYQSGGEMMPWETHLVGENGPELFASPVGGNIIPSHTLSAMMGFGARTPKAPAADTASARFLSQLVDINRRQLARMEMDQRPSNGVTVRGGTYAQRSQAERARGLR